MHPHDPGARLRDIAAGLGITERSAYGIITGLTAAGTCQAERRPPQPLPDPGAPGGRGVERPHLPHRLVCTDSYANTASIIAVIKTQGSDTKPVGQMQPYYEAKSLRPVELAGQQVPPLVTQIADGENGGVMTNEFPPKYLEVMRECSGSPTPAVNVTEYLEALAGRGISREDPPPVQPLLQHRV